MGIGAHSVNWYNPRVLELPCDPGLDQEALPPDGTVAMLSSYLFESDQPLELPVLGDENHAKAPFRMRPDNPIPNGLMIGCRFVVGHRTRRILTPSSLDMGLPYISFSPEI
jgi:hypothetical protein